MTKRGNGISSTSLGHGSARTRQSLWQDFTRWRSCKCHNEFMTDSSTTVLRSGVIPDVVDDDLDFWDNQIVMVEAGALELKGLLDEDLAGL